MTFKLKKAIALLAVEGLLFSGFSVYAAENSGCAIRGILSSGNTLHFSYESAEGISTGDFEECKWYKASDKNGEFAEVGSGLKYKTTPTTATEYYYASATLSNGEKYTTDIVEIAGYDGNFAYWPNQMSDVDIWERVDNKETVLEYPSTLTNTKNYFYGCRLTSDEKYMFKVDGQSFVLVDTIETSDTARYKIIAEETYGKIHMASEEGRNSLLDKLPEGVTEHIDNTIYYHGYKNTWGGFGGDIVCGAYIVSPEDLVTYKDKIGLLTTNFETGEFAAYALNGNSKSRTDGSWIYSINAYDADKKQLTIGINAANVKPTLSEKELKEVRPVFNVDKDFFADVKLDTDGIGAEVKKVILNSYTKDELQAVYPETVLEDVFGFKQSFEITSIAAVNSEEECNITVNIANNCGEYNVWLFTGLYSAEGQLKAAIFKEIAAELNGTAAVNMTMSLTADSGDTIRSMVVDKAGGMNVFGRGFVKEIK